MTDCNVRIMLEDGAGIPVYGSELAAGADLHAYLPDGSVVLKPMERALIPTGIRMALPAGFEAQVRPRSGLAAKSGITVLNTPGTVDADYRGEVKVILINLSNENFTVKNGDRIAQLVIAPCTHAQFTEVKTLDETERGEGGFGSTGV